MSPDQGSSHDDANKQSIERKLREQIDNLRGEIDRLQGKARQSEGEKKQQLEREAESLQRQLDQADARLKEMEGSSSEAWQEIRQGVESGWTEVDAALRRAREKFR